MILRATILIAFIISSVFAKAQHYSVNNRFSISDNKACAPFQIIINAPACNGSFPCDANFGDGVFRSITDGYAFQYTEAGTYTINIIFGTTGSDELQLTITPNILPSFDIYSCNSNGVKVNITDTNYDEYVIDYNDGNTEIFNPGMPMPDHTFANAGGKTITVRGRNLNANDNCNAENKTIDAIASIPAAAINQLSVLDNKRIQLDFTNTTPNVLYKLEIATNNATTFQTIQNVYNTNTALLDNLNIENNYYCFRLQAFDPCNNIGIPSNTICSSKLTVAPANNHNKLNWVTAAIGTSNFTVNKNPGITLTAPAGTTSIDDFDINCGTEYCYELITHYGDNSRSISLARCTVAISDDTPSSISDISTIVNQDKVELRWVQDPAFTAQKYSVTKSIDESFTSIGSTSATSFTDSAYSVDALSCYKISYEDVCGNLSSVSKAVCPMHLTATLQKDNTVSLTWTPFNGWEDGVANYVIEKYNEEGALIGTLETSATNIIDDTEDLFNQVYVYRIVAQPLDISLSTSISNTITIIKEPNLYYPTAFTPNGDGTNDIFLVFGQYTTKFEMKIFNRWGELLFITENLEHGWDGTYKGNKMPEGTYVFTATITDIAGRKFDRSGTIVLLKK